MNAPDTMSRRQLLRQALEQIQPIADAESTQIDIILDPAGQSQITRRDILRLAALGATGAALTACTGETRYDPTTGRRIILDGAPPEARPTAELPTDVIDILVEPSLRGNQTELHIDSIGRELIDLDNPNGPEVKYVLDGLYRTDAYSPPYNDARIPFISPVDDCNVLPNSVVLAEDNYNTYHLQKWGPGDARCISYPFRDIRTK